jgi:hypothetical protein
MANYFNRKDFGEIILNSSQRVSKAFDSASGKQVEYDVFISHSSKPEDKSLVRQIRQLLEDHYKLSAYIDWDEDYGMSRDEASDKIKLAMDVSKSFIVVKTSNSDESQWVAWETGRFDSKDSDKIGVLLIEDDDKFTVDTWKHREFLKDYIILEKADVVSFVANGAKKIIAAKKHAQELNSALASKSVILNEATGQLNIGKPMSGTTTKFYGTNKK